MNTTDRSIALIDAALRRHFYFLPLLPDGPPVKGLLARWLKREKKTDLLWVAELLDRANALLGANRHGLLGPSYFMRPSLSEAFVRLSAATWSWAAGRCAAATWSRWAAAAGPPANRSERKDGEETLAALGPLLAGGTTFPTGQQSVRGGRDVRPGPGARGEPDSSS